ncbi:hypothetical protein ACJX0J_007737, partial [Zea mays]
ILHFIFAKSSSIYNHEIQLLHNYNYKINLVRDSQMAEEKNSEELALVVTKDITKDFDFEEDVMMKDNYFHNISILTPNALVRMGIFIKAQVDSLLDEGMVLHEDRLEEEGIH